jgi:hypothetical protein
VTVTVTLEAGDVPPAPVQVTEYVVLVVGDTNTDPLVALLVVILVPVQLVAFVDIHVRRVLEPDVMLVELAASVAVGAAA